ncbi:reprolysin-like metallopeptidase [Parasediminibacterium sp. JCM 36343]|uniref:reprolysin-like metallopeptidase n=1 Tax=Parasediminibacterium sp. JCM 36343 TaxID=3374279 RepID=UPI00397ADBAF
MNFFTRIIQGLLGSLLITSLCFAQTKEPINCWAMPKAAERGTSTPALRIKPSQYHLMQLDTVQMRAALAKAPQEFKAAAKAAPLILSLPMPDGKMAKFKIEAVQTMAPELAAKFPNIKTYGGQGIDDPTAAIKIDFTELGFHAMVMSDITGNYFIDPAYKNNNLIYLSYYKKDLKKNQTFVEDVRRTLVKASEGRLTTAAKPPAGKCVGTELRTYRLAIACTGEYAIAATGLAKPTVAQTLSAIVTSANRVTGIYEKEVAVRMQLVANEDLVVFTDTLTDPFKGNNDANTLIDESQTVITKYIGSANFDIGHTFSTGGGGLAQVGCVCQDAYKASGITGSPDPVGDAYDVDYVAHEIGHEFGGDHTFNANTGSCSGNGSSTTNAEPGSGVTIMAYAGICGTTNDLAPHSIAIFHAVSYDEITNYTNLSDGNTCAVITNTGNNPPVVNAGSDYTIPFNTPFTLMGAATDPDGDSLTYCWEQTNTGGAFGNWTAPAGNAPIFRSFLPVATPARTFPVISDIVGNKTTIGERLPAYARTLEFRLTARDNRNNGGGVCYDVMNVNVIKTATPFAVTYPTLATTWTVGEFQNVTWNVSGTNVAPIKCTAVAIELSIDGGYTYPITLVDSTANDGSQQITVPINITKTARIRVRALGNIFFDISNTNFTIQLATKASFSTGYATTPTTCVGNDATTTLNVAAIGSFQSPVTLTATGLPGATTVAFSKNTFTPAQDTVVLTISNTSGLTAGSYSFTVKITGDTITQTRTVAFNVVSITTYAVSAVQPAANTTGQSLQPTFIWKGDANAVSYDFSLATDSLFSNVIKTASVADSFYVLPITLDQSTEYYWKIRPITSLCGGITGQYTPTIRFKTGLDRCLTLKNTTPVTISTTKSVTITSSLVVPVDSIGTVTDVNVVGVNITHSYISDLKISLISPKGTTAVLVSDVCDSLKNMNLSFDDEAAITTVPCPPTTGVTVKPVDALAIFKGEPAVGTWKLSVFDQYAGDGGKLNAWGLQICRLALVALPVNWQSFTAIKQSNNTVLLQWKTANEQNNQYFSVEKSADGVSYSSIGTIKGAASSTTLNEYMYTDAEANTGVVYYRIRQVDADGLSTYSQVLSIVFGSNHKLSLYPNPARNTVLIQSAEKMHQVQLFAVNGKLVYTGKPNANSITLPVSNYAAGTYTVRVLTATDVVNSKLIIQK